MMMLGSISSRRVMPLMRFLKLYHEASDAKIRRRAGV
jgi:hypothetical protein